MTIVIPCLGIVRRVPKFKAGTPVRSIELLFLTCKYAYMAAFDNDDLKVIEDLMQITIEDAIEAKGLVTKEDLSHLPTKDDFYTKMDEVMGELKP